MGDPSSSWSSSVFLGAGGQRYPDGQMANGLRLNGFGLDFQSHPSASSSSSDAFPISMKVEHHDVLNADRMAPFIEQCMKDSPQVFLTLVIIAFISAAVTGAISWSHSRKLASAPLSLQRKFYIRMMWFAPVVGLTSFTSLLCPRTLGLNELVRTQFEAVTIWVFGTIVFLLMAKESAECCSGDEFDEDNSVGAKMIAALAIQGPRKHFGMPPLGCCFIPCMKAHDLTRRQLQFARNCFTQYVYVYAVLGYLNAFMGLALDDHGVDRFRNITEQMIKVSGLVAIWGLMVIWRSTAKLLSKWNTGVKFWSIKGVVMINVLQLLLLDWIAKISPGLNIPCFGKFSIRMWANFLLSLEGVGLAWLVCKAFPVGELQEWHDELHIHAAQVEMEGMFQSSTSRSQTGTPQTDQGSLDFSLTDSSSARPSAPNLDQVAEAPVAEEMEAQTSAKEASSQEPKSFDAIGATGP